MTRSGAGQFFEGAARQEKEDRFLREHQYSLEEAAFGLRELLERSGHGGLLELVREEG